MRFILALSPPRDLALFLISSAQTLFSPMSEGYLLSDTSLPHITLYQFTGESREEAIAIFSEMQRKFPQSLTPCITGVHFIRKNHVHQVELSVKRDPTLMKMHLFAKDLIEKNGFVGLTEDQDLYRPHITLVQVRKSELLPRWPDDFFEMNGEFQLSLGLGNELGQYLETIAESSP